ncbi:MAG: class I SAM-dependent rRNA methyltransferase [Bacteroidaceae bacterium]|nr:class I SAM-dependent rRNA methyltransferase [Bacteroidaceae bacterium]
MNKTIILRKGKEESLLRFHPWIFSGAIHHVESAEPLEEGDLVEVLSSDGRFLAIGHWQIGSIAVRVLTFKRQPINQAFWQKRLATALDVRRTIGVTGREDNDIYRLVHGEGDNLPGLVIDIYGTTAVMQAHSVGMHVCRHELAQALREVMGDSLKAIYYKSETTLPFKAQLGQELGASEAHLGVETSKNGFLYKEASGEEDIVNSKLSNCKCDDVARENGLMFHIDWLKGQKTGFFVDQRDNRSLVEHYAKGRRVLNMFCYTGGFSVYAMRGGAELVHSVDSSAKAIELVDANIELNFPGDTRHKAFAEDAFKFMEEPPSISPKGEEMVNGKSSNGKCLYDLIILDPPAFAKHKDALRNALRGYTKLNAKAFEMIQPGGILFTFSCSQAVNKDQFRMAVFTAAAMAKRKVHILHQLHQPADHPINIYHPEGEYLKGLVLYVE